MPSCCLLGYTRPREPTNERRSHQNAGFSMSFQKFSGDNTPDPHSGRGRPPHLPTTSAERKRPGVGTQILVPLNFSAVVAPLHVTITKWATIPRIRPAPPFLELPIVTSGSNIKLPPCTINKQESQTHASIHTHARARVNGMLLDWLNKTFCCTTDNSVGPCRDRSIVLYAGCYNKANSKEYPATAV